MGPDDRDDGPTDAAESDAAGPDGIDDDPGQDTTGVVAIARPRLGDYLSGDPELPYALLIVVAGPCRGAVEVVDRLPVVVGRRDDVDVTISDETVSRRHAQFAGDRAHLEVEDLGSSNGTTLNGNPIVGAIGLLDGDIVGFGDAVVVVKVLR